LSALSHIHSLLHLTLGAILFGHVTLALAQEPEIIELGNGTSLTINEYLIETDDTGYKTLVIKTSPNFNPEPFGEMPSDDFARLMQPLCGNLVDNSADTLEQEGISAVRLRWDFTPERSADMPDNMTLSRFHEWVFDIADNAPCVPKPLGVGLDNLTPDLSTDISPTLRWAEAGLTPGELSLTYAVETGLEDISASELDRAAIELCILHADTLLETRAQYYEQLYSRSVAITFEQDDEKPGFKLMRRVTFGVQKGRCATGLSDMLTEAIRSK
jgi:hypothetical protein